MSNARRSPSRRSEPGGRDGNAELARTDAVFAALAHASRRQVLLTLHLRGGTMSAGEIADRFACTWPTTSRHLAVLASAGLVTIEKRGRERIYKVAVTELTGVVGEWLAWFHRAAAPG